MSSAIPYRNSIAEEVLKKLRKKQNEINIPNYNRYVNYEQEEENKKALYIAPADARAITKQL